MLEDKAKFQKLPASSSLVYRKPRLPSSPKRAQAINFRLAPLLAFEDSGSTRRISDANAWTTMTVSQERGRLPCFPDRMSSRQTWLRRFSKLEAIDEMQSGLESPIRPLSTESCPASDLSTPLPVFKRRMPTETFLFRRPTIEKPIPLKVGDDIFDVFVKSIELKALPFKKNVESYRFYKTNFPLLLTRITQDAERCPTPNRRAKTPPISAMINRKREMNQRIVELEFMMEVMEKETEDCMFVTELHSPVFDPTSWPWNKVDVDGLRRRYTIDASLRDT